MADLTVAWELRNYLIDQGIATAPPGDTLPVIIVDPRFGAKEPDVATTVKQRITLIASGMTALPPMHEWLEERIIECIVRSTKSEDGELLQRRIRTLLNEKSMLLIGALQTEYIDVWKGAQPLGSDATSYTTTQSFRVQARLKSLAGMPYVP